MSSIQTRIYLVDETRGDGVQEAQYYHEKLIEAIREDNEFEEFEQTIDLAILRYRKGENASSAVLLSNDALCVTLYRTPPILV